MNLPKSNRDTLGRKISISSLKHLLTPLILSFIFFSCNKDNSITQQVAPSPNEQLYTLQGTVTDSISSQPITAAEVILNNFMTLTDTLGEFRFDSLKAGKYQVNIEQSDYHDSAFQIDLQKDSILNVKLKKIQVDYFPLSIGNKWSYNKIYITIFEADSGKADWEVINKIETDTLTTYQIQETFNGISVDLSHDTTYINNAQKIININETPDQKISMQNILFGNGTTPMFDRYYSPSASDTVNAVYIDQLDKLFVKLEKETGLVYFKDYYGSGNSSNHNIVYNLIQ